MNASIDSYILKPKGISDMLAVLQHSVSNDALVEFVLAGLGPNLSTFHKITRITSRGDFFFLMLCMDFC